ncbi:MAG: DNA gyrase subunit A [Deltaproteobacteria bacterium]|nr:DNA gyrase subunit A [Deltaproteobacteria bacterium]
MEALEGHKIPVNIEEEMKRSYLDYAMSVIIGRALPDIRDGLKPVHRRILYAMFREGLLSSKRFSKSAGVVGEVLKKYHPHGDAAVYDSLVRMVQDWNLRYPLVEGQGNFGSIDGDPAAAYRYTEVRLTAFAEEMLNDLDKETVDFVPNFDGSVEEPTVLPSMIPNLLVNGSSGIAVGMATNIPPHNLGEVCGALTALIKNPDLPIEKLMGLIPGPDFPTGGFIHGKGGIAEAYKNGRGIIQMRAKAMVEKDKRTGRESIVITEIPYQTNKAKIIERIAELVREKKIEGISDIRDESDRDGIRMVVELKKDEISEVILNNLYKHTPLQDSFGVILLTLIHGQPRVLNLKNLLQEFINFRKEIVTRRCRYELRKAEERAHLLEGFKKAIENLDAIIKLIRASKDPETAKTGLIEKFEFSAIQAQAILDMRLQRLTALEREKILEEFKQVLAQIKRLKEILASDKEILNIVSEELENIKKKYADERRTQILGETKEIGIEDLIVEEDMVVTISHLGYIKRNPVSLYRAQRRGGRGKMGMGVRDEDFVESLFIASTHSYILFFTTKGKLYWLKVHEIPQAGRAAKGKPIVNLFNLGADEKITAYLPVKEFQEGRHVLMATQNGTIKKTDLMAFSNPRAGGIIACTMEEGDSLVAAKLTDGERDVYIGTRQGMSIRFSEKQIRSMGRMAQGVHAIKLRKGDLVEGVEVVNPGTTILTVTEKGYGKRTEVEEYRMQNRGGIGIIGIRVTDKNGPICSVLQVAEEDEIMLISDHGKIIRTKAKDISIIGRATQGVKLIGLDEGEKVVGVARVVEKEEEGGASEEAEEPASS